MLLCDNILYLFAFLWIIVSNKRKQKYICNHCYVPIENCAFVIGSLTVWIVNRHSCILFLKILTREPGFIPADSRPVFYEITAIYACRHLFPLNQISLWLENKIVRDICAHYNCTWSFPSVLTITGGNWELYIWGHA